MAIPVLLVSYGAGNSELHLTTCTHSDAKRYMLKIQVQITQERER
jgi:hypothetical protein